MLEVINGFLLVYFTVLCTISALIPQIVKTISGCFTRPSSQERLTWSNIIKLKEQQKGISMKDEFAAYSKLQRQINKLENQLKEDTQSRTTKSLAIKGSVHLVLQSVIGFLIVASVIWYRRQPIVALNVNLFPFTTILSYPSVMPNAISTHMWVLISNVSIRALIKPFIQ